MGVERTILQSKEIFIFDIFEAPQGGHGFVRYVIM
jgi:hypothetical protein